MANAWKGLKNTLEITEIPDYALNKKLPADSYFTSEKTAKKCLNILYDTLLNDNINLTEYTFIEPGAGDGGFYDNIIDYTKIGIDIVDRRDDIITSNFLKWKPDDLSKKYISIGNPPFGVRGSIALAFLNRCLLFSDYVGFILPMSFHSNGKGSAMSRVKNGHLVKSIILEQETFFSPDNNKEIKINTLFQIWKTGHGVSIFKDYDISEYAEIKTVNSDPNRYCGMEYINDYDFFVNSSFYGNDVSIVYNFSDVKYSAGYGIIIKKNRQEILKKISNINFYEYSSKATNSVNHIRMHHIQKCLYDLGYGREVKNKNQEFFSF
jgi:hypothetical protein